MPGIPKWILSRLCSRTSQEGYAGDIEEEFKEITILEGKASAVLWIWYHAMIQAPISLCTLIRWRMYMFWNYLKIAIRNIGRQKGFSFINIFGLSLGVAVFLLIFLYISHELSYDRFHENHERIFRLSTHRPGHMHQSKDKMARSPYNLAPGLQQSFPEVEDFTRVVYMGDGKFTIQDESFFEKKILYAEPNFFQFFTFELIQGRAGEVLTDPYSVVISERIRDKYFGSDDPVGKNIRLNDDADLTVRGVMANMPENTQFETDFIVSIQAYALINKINLWDWPGGVYSFIRLHGEMSSFQQRMAPAIEKLIPQDGHFKHLIFLQRLGDIHLRTDLDGELGTTTDVRTLYVFGTIAALILLVACINYTNLTTARSTLRIKELGIRKVVGARRGQLIDQIISETVCLALLAFVLACGILAAFLPMFNRFVDRSIGLTRLFSYPVGLWSMLAFVSVVAAAGIYPALFLSLFKPSRIFQSRSMQVSKRFNLRSALVVFQFGVSIFLIICTLTVNKQLHFIRNFKIGYDKEQIVVFAVEDPHVREKLPIIKSELSQLPHIQKVSSSAELPNLIRSQARLEWPGKPEEPWIPVYVESADYDFVDLFGLELIQGRNFSRAFSEDAQGAFLINEQAARAAGWENPIGREIVHWSDAKGRVVGVLKNFHFHSLHRPIDPLYIFLEKETEHYWLSIKMDGTAIHETLEQILNYLTRIPSNHPFEFEFFDDVFDRSYRSEMRLEKVFTVFAGLSIVIAGMGLLGLASFLVSRRTKEIGIRKALGSSEGSLVWTLTGSFLKWVLIANIIAWPSAWWIMHNWLQDFSYKTPMKWDLFVFAGVSTLFVAAILIGYQAIHAARANPSDSLRYE